MSVTGPISCVARVQTGPRAGPGNPVTGPISCVARVQTGPRAGASDLFIAAGLNGRIGSKEYAALRAVAGEAFEALAEIPDDQTFWGLPRSEILEPSMESPSWHLHRAWWLLEGAEGIKVARAHKV